MQLLKDAMACKPVVSHPIYWFLFCLLLIHVAKSDQVSSLKDEAEYLVFSFLDYSNQGEGASFVGGPFSISHISLQWKEGKKEKYLFSYDAPLPLQGYPHGFDVIVEQGMSESIRSILSESASSFDGNLSIEIVDILETFRNDQTRSNGPADLLEYVSFDNDQIVRRWKASGGYVYGFRKINDTRYQILFCRSFSEDHPFLFIHDRQEPKVLYLHTEPDNLDIEDECSLSNYGKITRLSKEQKFLLFGTFSDDD